MLGEGDCIDGRYRIYGEKGKGGGGIVYLAEHLALKKQVVLKQIINGSPDMELLRTEVDILKRLRHPALPQVYDFVNVNGNVFTVMEYIEGYNLQEYLDAGDTFSQEQIVIWARQLAEVLVYMHGQAQPVIHRDIKPSNIMIKPDGNICLIDFNISEDTTKALSQDGYSLGYASPEQIQKVQLLQQRIVSDYVQVDVRSDIYSMGAVLYRLLTGRVVPKEYEALAETEWCFYPLAKIVDKCLKVRKEERYSSARDVLHDLMHLEKTDKEYRKLTLGTRLATAVCIFLVIISAMLVIYGNNLNAKDAYYAEYILVEGEMAFLKKEYRKALGDFKKAKETAVDEEVRQKGASFYAKTCITLTDYQEAIKTLEAKGEYELADWMNLAFAYKCTGNWKKSKELLLQAVLYYPEDYRLYMRLCYLECELQDRKLQALKDYSQLKVYYDKAVSLLNGKTGNEEWIQLKSLIVQLKEYGWM